MSIRPLRSSAFALLLSVPVSAGANDVSPDITISLGGVTTADEDVAEDLGGSFALIDVGPLPGNVDVVGYEVVGAGVQLALDTTVALSPGGVTAEPRDVVLWDGASYSIAFDGSAEGVPPGVGIDAVGAGLAAELLLSFDTTLDLPGVPGVPDEAVVSFDGATFAVVFDGTALGASAAPLDTDGVARVSSDTLRLSFDTSGTVGGVSFDDEDALDYESTGGTWTLAYDGSASDPAWGAADLVALPEPALAAALAAGSALLAGLRRRSALRRERTLR